MSKHDVIENDTVKNLKFRRNMCEYSSNITKKTWYKDIF